VTDKGRTMSSSYMEWAKTRSHCRFNLATSGVANYPLSELPVRLEDLEISGPSSYGYQPLQQALARKCGVPPECIVAAAGTSMANHLAMAATITQGDEVVIEAPTYELLTSTASYLGAEIKTFPRRFEDGFRIDPADVERSVSSRTRLIVLTNLHNPSGAVCDEDTLRRIGQVARRSGAMVLVDEVYLDAAFEAAPSSAIHLGEEFIVTSSLTKVYGLSGLRCGWILARPDLAARMWRLNDLFGVIPAHAAERLSVIALDNLDRISARTRALLDTNRLILREMLSSCPGLVGPGPEYGTVAFPRLRNGSVDALCEELRDKYETTVVPGSFFGMPRHFRIGIGGDTETLREGLARLGHAIKFTSVLPLSGL
jgi:aspartate/methionine/tyrosine aminotransferase